MGTTFYVYIPSNPANNLQFTAFPSGRVFVIELFTRRPLFNDANASPYPRRFLNTSLLTSFSKYLLNL